jgi:tetratricopeptide (TPR) repeat protein
MMIRRRQLGIGAAVIGMFSATVFAETVAELYQAGIDQISRGNYGQAVVLINECIEANPLDACLYNTLGYCRMKTGRFEEAEAALTRSIELTCVHVDRAYFNRARLHMQQKNYSAALADADVAIGLMKKENPFRYYVRGKIHYRLGDYPSAASDFAEALELDPHMDAALVYRARVRWKAGEYRMACRDVFSIHKLSGTLEYAGFPLYFLSAWIVFPSLIFIKLRYASQWTRLTRKQCDFMTRVRLMNRKQAERCMRFETGRVSSYLYVTIGFLLMGVSVPLFFLPLFI